jgi:2-methylisocitrate lyase-like PEP mutase family enzyme
MLPHEINRSFRDRLKQGGAILMPGAANALTARVIDGLGFEAMYISGAGVTNTALGMPDHGFISLPELVQHTASIRNVTDLPLVVDVDTGFGNAVNVHHTVRMMERAGASAIQLEDQVMPKKCGHFQGKDVVDLGEARSRIKAAVDARQDENFLIVARTDARATRGCPKRSTARPPLPKMVPISPLSRHRRPSRKSGRSRSTCRMCRS